MNGNHQITLRRHGGIHNQGRQRSNDSVPGNIARGCFNQFGAIDLPPGKSRYNGISLPPGWAEYRSTVDRQIEIQSAGGLVLRLVIKYAGFVDHTRQVLRMPGWETVMSPLLDMQELVVRISVGKPGGPFLFGGEKISFGIECHGLRKSCTRTVSLALTASRLYFQHRLALATDVVV